MTKAIEAIVILTLLVFAFFIGVKYSESVKSHASWLFESKEEEVELPDLSNENGEIGATVDENGEAAPVSGSAVEAAPQDAAPMDNIDNTTPQNVPTQPAPALRK